ncbi:TRAP transporter large permease [Agrobacterium sp. CNPSo 2736]|uniref:TRAP transporter large permease n=1 Tax=Agrobacterium sp. CNPSo 2736 TaxID=2499627 RepID=UPI000FD7DD21|nr:TRAP transporter large permease [Agrobacterium sp. CNPSo 2736]RVT73033.1 TRAP transporter large permease [Agrobacterium sp. CNPSo 2736]
MVQTMMVVLSAWAFLLVLGMPIYASMILSAILFVAAADLPMNIIPQKIAQSGNSFPLIAAPLFILMGNIMNAAGVTDRIFGFSAACVGWVRGGLAHANIVASVIFAGMTGSAVADAGGVGSLEIRAMKAEGYDAETAAAITAASATIGPIIPPSLPMVIYGVSADVSIGGLFLAGIIPGLLMALALSGMVVMIAKRRGLPQSKFAGISVIWLSYKRAHWALMTPVMLFGGMMAGIMTPTEASAVASAYALFLGLFVYRELTLKDIPEIVIKTMETIGVVLPLVMAASAMAWCLSISRIPQLIIDLFSASISSPLLYILIVNVTLLVVGCFIESIAAMLIFVPILVPIAHHMGIDPIQFGLIFILNLMIGTITPPVGVVLFITSKLADVSLDSMSRAILPWILPLLIVLAAISLWPPLTTYLPSLFLR